MFGIIAGVLIGVWAMYTMLSDQSDASVAIAEIQLLTSAGQQYKANNAISNTYWNVNHAQLMPYLGEGMQGVDVLGEGSNVFGGRIRVYPDFRSGAANMKVEYHGIRSIGICKRILENFGEVEEVPFLQNTTNYVIPAGKTITGYVGSQLLFPRDMGCEMQHPNLPIALYVTID